MHNLRVCLGVLILAAMASCSKQESDDAGINGSGTGSTGSGSTGSGSTGNASSTLGGDANVGGNGSGTGSTGTGSTGAGSTTGSDVGGTGSGDVGGTGSGTGGSTDIVACTTVSGTTKSSSAPPVIEFALDNTNSMSDTTQPSTKGLSKWKALQNAFTTAIPKLAADHPTYAVGLTYFHYRGYGPPGNPCTDALQAVEIAPLSANSATIVSNVNAEGQIQMTPTQDIWQFSADHVLAWNADPVYAQSNRYVVVLTDGVPTVGAGCTTAAGCNGSQGISSAQYQPFIDVVGSTKQSRSLTTFMIAVPGAEALNQVTCSDASIMYTPIAKMSEVASAGGTDLIDLTTSATTDFTAALVAALVEIVDNTSAVVGCEYPVPEPPTDVDGNVQFIDPTQVAVMYYQNGGTSCSSDADCGGAKCSLSTASNPNKCYSTIPRSDGCTDPNGWEYTDSTNKTIQLCSNVCNIAQADTGAKIEVIIGCFRVG